MSFIPAWYTVQYIGLQHEILMTGIVWSRTTVSGPENTVRNTNRKRITKLKKKI